MHCTQARLAAPRTPYALALLATRQLRAACLALHGALPPTGQRRWGPARARPAVSVAQQPVCSACLRLRRLPGAASRDCPVVRTALA